MVGRVRLLPAFARVSALAVAFGAAVAARSPATGLVTPPTWGTPAAPASPVPSSTLAPVGATREAKVVRVVDGDTIVVAIGAKQFRVRYIGMDTPESVKPSSPVEWMGPEASEANARLVGGRTVVLEKDVSETDQYGRLLRYVWLHDAAGWTFVNLRLVELGYASVYTWPPDVRYADLFLAAERRAREAGLGLWAPH